MVCILLVTVLLDAFAHGVAKRDKGYFQQTFADPVERS